MCGLYIVGIHFDLLFSSTLLPSAISMASHPVYITWSLVVFVVGCIIRVYTRCIYPESILPVCNWWWSCEWVWMKQAMVRCTYLVVGREGNARRWFARWARRGDVVGFRFHSRSLHAKSTTAKITTRLRPLLLPKGFRCQRLNLSRNTQNHYYYQTKIKKKGGTCRICAC